MRSRRAWRIPSFVDRVDPCFWQSYANFGSLESKSKLLSAMSLNEETFYSFFPEFDLDDFSFNDKDALKSLINRAKSSSAYNTYLLDLAERERPIILDYLRQEIDSHEKFALVEYWGRGYTQDNFVRLWQEVVKEAVDVPFYYSRTVLPTIGHSVRYNFTTNSAMQFFIEGFFSNLPYKSIEKFERVNGRVEPVITPINCNLELYEAMQSILPEYAKEYAYLELKDRESLDHMLYDFALNYYLENRDNPYLGRHIGTLIDSVALYGKKRQFAPPLTLHDLERLQNREITRGNSKLSTAITMSVARTEPDVQEKYFEMYQIFPGDNIVGGTLLTLEQQEENQKYRELYLNWTQRTTSFNEFYQNAADFITVQNRILFVSNDRSFDENDEWKLICRISESTDMICEELALSSFVKKDDKRIAEILAGSRFIISTKPIKLFAKVEFRPETIYILLKTNAFNLFNVGLLRKEKLKWKKKYQDLCASNDFHVLSVPSDILTPFLLSCYTGKTSTDCSIKGNCFAECMFDSDYIDLARRKLFRAVPEAKGKKVILYIPRFRLLRKSKNWANLLDLEELHNLIGNNYYVVVNLDTADPLHNLNNVLNVPGFSKLVTVDKSLTLRELAASSDIVIGDYRDSFFESAIMHKPMFSTACDYEEIMKKDNLASFIGDFEENMLFCPLVKNAKELAKELEVINEYDFSLMEQFAQKYFTFCDGHSFSRLLQYLDNNRIPAELLTENDPLTETNEKWRKQCQILQETGELFCQLYNKAAGSFPVEKRAVCISSKNRDRIFGLSLVNEMIQYSVPCNWITVKRDMNMEEMRRIAEELAKAKYVFSDGSVNLLFNTLPRDESEFILCRETPYQLYRQRNREQFLLTFQNKYEDMNRLFNPTVLQVPSIEQEAIYKRNFCGFEISPKISFGMSSSDVYFNPTFREKSRKKITHFFQNIQASNTLLLYMPTVGSFKKTHRDRLPIDLNELCSILPEKYRVILYLNARQKKKLKTALSIPDNCVEVINELSQKELIAASDVFVGDYRDGFFEAAITGKPCFSTAFDCKEMIAASKGALRKQDSTSIQFCPVISSADELAQAISRLDQYDNEVMSDFIQYAFGECNGMSTEKLLHMLL